jgi:mannose/fructose-specific phosphotransferase system component IIA
MSELLRAVVVSHAGVGQALVRAVGDITGVADGIVAVSNDGCSAKDLGERVAAAVGTDPALVFVDLPGGSCFQAAARYLHAHDGVAVVAGVNLAMLIDFVYHRDLPAAAAATRAVEAGGRAIRHLAR